MTKLSSAEAAELFDTHILTLTSIERPNPAVTVITWQWYEDDPVRDLKLYLTDVGAGHDHAQWRLE